MNRRMARTAVDPVPPAASYPRHPLVWEMQVHPMAIGSQRAKASLYDKNPYLTWTMHPDGERHLDIRSARWPADQDDRRVVSQPGQAQGFHQALDQVSPAQHRKMDLRQQRGGLWPSGAAG